MSKTIQIRVNEQEYNLIKKAFNGENLSKYVRDFLLAEAEKRFENSDMSMQENDSSIQSFIEMLSDPSVQQVLFKIFKSTRGGDNNK